MNVNEPYFESAMNFKVWERTNQFFELIEVKNREEADDAFNAAKTNSFHAPMQNSICMP